MTRALDTKIDSKEIKPFTLSEELTMRKSNLDVNKDVELVFREIAGIEKTVVIKK